MFISFLSSSLFSYVLKIVLLGSMSLISAVKRYSALGSKSIRPMDLIRKLKIPKAYLLYSRLCICKISFIRIFYPLICYHTHASSYYIMHYTSLQTSIYLSVLNDFFEWFPRSFGRSFIGKANRNNSCQLAACF